MKPICLLVLPCALLSASCGPKPLEVATPPVERFEPVAEPAIPAGDTDREVAGYIRSLIGALREANLRLSWLADWREGVTD